MDGVVADSPAFAASPLMGRWMHDLRRTMRKWKFSGDRRYCPVCESRTHCFLPGGQCKVREEARCPVCGSLERHRLVWQFLERRTNLFDGAPKRLLHIAPEKQFVKRFERLSNLDYVTGDLFDPTAMVRVDLTEMPFDDETFDAVYCSHVLEHVPNDAAAMSELYRVLAPGGWAVLQVPITGETTYEDWSIDTPEGRLAAFGQDDHVRVYGRDYAERLRTAGFEVRPVAPSEFLTVDEMETTRVDPMEDVYFCRKAA